MLSRTADHLFWMSRYIERAENLARLLDVTYQMSLVPQQARHGSVDHFAGPALGGLGGNGGHDGRLAAVPRIYGSSSKLTLTDRPDNPTIRRLSGGSMGFELAALRKYERE